MEHNMREGLCSALIEGNNGTDAAQARARDTLVLPGKPALRQPPRHTNQPRTNKAERWANNYFIATGVVYHGV